MDDGTGGVIRRERSDPGSLDREDLKKASACRAKPTPPLLFVHGAAHGAWCWDEHFIPWFTERGFQAVALDLRGHGSRRGSPLRWVPLSAYVEDVNEAAAKLERPPVLVGHSVGGSVVERYLSAGGRAAGAVLASPVPHNLVGFAMRYSRANPVRFLTMLATLSFKPMVGTPGAFSIFFSPAMPRNEIARLQAYAQEESFRAFLDGVLTPLARPRPAAVPTLVVAGSEDAMFTVDEERKIADYHRAEFDLLPGIGHDLMLDVGWEGVAERIARFVRSLSSSPASSHETQGSE